MKKDMVDHFMDAFIITFMGTCIIGMVAMVIGFTILAGMAIL